MFELSEHILNELELRSSLINQKCGALVTFEGWVRDFNEGKPVSRLDYQAYEELALSEGNKICAEAIEKFGAENMRCVHRTGQLNLGEIAIWIGVVSVHRDAAFKACQYVIDEVKSRVPIWKREHYVDHDSGWVNCEQCARKSFKSSGVSMSIGL